MLTRQNQNIARTSNASGKQGQLVFFLISTLFLAGCADRFQPDAVAEIQVAPVTVTVKVLNQTQLDVFFDDNRTDLLILPTTIGYAKGSERLAASFRRQLLAQGADPDNVDLLHLKGEVSGVTVSFVRQRTQVSECQPYRYRNELGFGHTPQATGCYVEGNRWMSLQHPERAAQPAAMDKVR